MSKVLRTILYVEDELDIQHVVKLALEATAGMQIIAYSSGEDAIAHNHNASVDLILLDVMMPNMDGPTTLARLRDISAYAQTPVVFMTAKTHPNEIAYFKSLGAVDVIAKPFDPLTLASTLREIWQRATTSSHDEKKTELSTPTQALTPQQRFAQRMAELTAQFQRELPGRFDTLRNQWRAWRQSPSMEALNALHCTTHNMAGAGSTFGYDELTKRARALDRQLKILLSQPQAVKGMAQTECDALFADLDNELQRILTQLNR